MFNIIKKSILVFFLVCCISNTYCQSRQLPNKLNYDDAPFHFGFQLGINQMLFTIKISPGYYKTRYVNINIEDQNYDSAFLYSLESTPSFGFVVGIGGNIRLSKCFDLRFTPSLTFGERNLDYSIKSFSGTSSPVTLNISKNIQSSFIEFPISLLYKGDRIHNARPYILAGGKYALDLASNVKKNKESHSALVIINRHDLYAVGGFGFDFYTSSFKFGVEISMSYGLYDVLKRDETIYTKAINRLNSKIFQITFTFEN